jgi:hypothetical protein
VAALGLLAGACAAAPALRADTIFLKDGTQILDCQVVSETAASVSVRTPVGDMVVPRSQIFRIQKVKTPYDQYKEQLDRIREGDVNGLFKLAQWCRTSPSLRKESDDLLEKVIELNEKHTQARLLLGHVKVQGEWVVPPRLKVRLKIAGAAGQSAKDVEEAVVVFLRSRPDISVVSGKEAADSVNECELTVTVSVGQRAAPRFYGKTLGRATVGASVRLRARSDWLGKERVETAVDGEAPAGGPDTGRLAVKNALGGGSAALHRFLDDVQRRRSKPLVAELEKAARSQPDPGAKPARPGTGDA